MHCLKNILCTCGLALILLISLPGQAQDELYHLLRFTLVPGQEQTFIRANADQNANDRNRSAQQHYAYVYSNHTVDIAVPTHELNDAESGPIKAWAELDWEPFADWVETRNPKTLAPTLKEYIELRLRRHAELSYSPAVAAPGEPAAYYNIVTYIARPGQLDKVLKMSRQYAALMREIESPLAYEFYTYDRGEPVEMFEIAYPADGPDDLAERRAAHAALETAAIREWRKSLALLADELRTITGRYVAELSSTASLSVNTKR